MSNTESYQLHELSHLSWAHFVSFLTRLDAPEDKKKLLAVSWMKHKASLSPADFAEVASKGEWIPKPHLMLANDLIMRSFESQTFNIISLPIRHGKSDLASKYATAWGLCKYPQKHRVVIGHSVKFATKFTAEARDLVEVFGPKLFDKQLSEKSSAKDNFSLHNQRGSVKAASSSSNIIGWTIDYASVDDLYPREYEAFSTHYNEELRDWFRGTFWSRLEPTGSVVLVLARWSQDDLAGWLVREAEADPLFAQWKEIKIPALCTDPDTDPLGRALGEALWPERYNESKLEQMRATMGELVFQAQVQQNPNPFEGLMFPPDGWRFIDDLPENSSRWEWVRYWDLTAGGPSSDFLAGALMTLDPRTGDVYIVDFVHKKCEDSQHVEEIIFETATRDQRNGRKYKKHLMQEPHIFLEQVPGAGKAIVEHYQHQVLSRFTVTGQITRGSKMDNALPIANRLRDGKVFLKRSGFSALQGVDPEYVEEMALMEKNGHKTSPQWHRDLIREAAEFAPNCRHDDMIDAISQGYNQLVRINGGNAKGSNTMAIASIAKRSLNTDYRRNSSGLYVPERNK